MRFVQAFEPKVVMIENVPALAKDERITRVLNELCEMGYNVGPLSLQVKIQHSMAYLKGANE